MGANTPTTSLTPRTTREWFEMFPEPYRTQAIENTKAQFPVNLNSDFDTPFDALKFCFNWGETGEIYDYWKDFHIKLLNGEIQLTEPKKDAAEQQMQEAESNPTLLHQTDLGYYAGLIMAHISLSDKTYKAQAAVSVKAAKALIEELKKQSNETETN